METIYNTEKKTEVEIEIIDVITGNDWTQDAFDSDDISYNEELNRLEANNEVCEWWAEYADECRSAFEMFDNLEENKKESVKQDYLDCYQEFNDAPKILKKCCVRS